MGITISFKADVDKTIAMLNRVQREAVPQAVASALNRTLTNVQVTAGREIRKNISLPAAFVRSQLLTKKASPVRWVAVLRSRVRDLPMTLFKPIVKKLKKLSRYGGVLESVSVKVSPKSRRRVIQRGFYAYGRKVIVQRQKGAARGPVKTLYGPSVDHRFAMPRTQHLMQWRALLQFPKHFKSQMSRLLARYQ